MSARVKLPPELADLLRSELERAIREAALYRDDELIARRYIIEKWCQMDIAAELGWERSTVSRHIPYILDEVKSRELTRLLFLCYNQSVETHRLLSSFIGSAIPSPFVDGVRLKRRLPDIPRERNGGVCIALAGNSSQGGDIHNTSRNFLDCLYWLDCCPDMG